MRDAWREVCGAGWTVQYLVRWEGCDPETDEEWESTWLGPDALTKDLLTEARKVEREKFGEVAGEDGRSARKRERGEPRREGGEEERQAEAIKSEVRGGRGRCCELVGEGEAQVTASRDLAGGG